MYIMQLWTPVNVDGYDALNLWLLLIPGVLLLGSMAMPLFRRIPLDVSVVCTFSLLLSSMIAFFGLAFLVPKLEHDRQLDAFTNWVDKNYAAEQFTDEQIVQLYEHPSTGVLDKKKMRHYILSAPYADDPGLVVQYLSPENLTIYAVLPQK